MLTQLTDWTVGILDTYVANKMIFKKPPQHFNNRKMPSQEKKKKKAQKTQKSG